MKKKLYHLSFNNHLPTILKPRQPDGYDLVKDKVEKLPDRVSFSPTIDQCLIAIKPNIKGILDNALHYSGFVIWVYEGIPDENTKYIPEEQVRKTVKDSNITGEICVTTPIHVKQLYQIKVNVTKVNNEVTFNGWKKI